MVTAAAVVRTAQSAWLRLVYLLVRWRVRVVRSTSATRTAATAVMAARAPSTTDLCASGMNRPLLFA